MKKLITCCLLVCLLAITALPVCAQTVNEQHTTGRVDSTISTTINPTYTVTIPASVSIDFQALTTDFGEIKVDAAQIHPDKCIRVTLASDLKLENSLDAEKVIPYKVMAGTSEFTTADYLRTNDQTDLSITITQADWDSAYAGSYSDTVTFSVAYVSIEP